MALDVHTLKNWPFKPVRQTYTLRDTMAYALSLGLGQDPLDTAALRFVYEPQLQALPMMAVVLGSPGFWAMEPGTGLDWVRLLHGEQHLELFAPLPAEGTVVGVTRVTALVDKGADKGALMLSERELTDASTGQRLALLKSTSFLRGDGGFAACGQPSDAAPPPPLATPDRAPDAVCDCPTRPEAALWYRLNGDFNPVHVDPQVAARAGFKQPILHGLCSWGMAGAALLRTLANRQVERFSAMGARFSSPVFPGETLRVEIWRGEAGIQFRTRALERDVVVLSHGYARFS
jgi:acyl dehydratase